ncbi:MAG: hypothetical protein HY911_03840 [Desulfobacterales bacterium]|nr:hypothetical protein [Desulfobacterales bacterium]
MMPSAKAGTARNKALPLYPPAAFASLLALLLIFSACAGVPVTFHDATTYTNLVDLKVDATLLVESFDTRKVKDNEAQITAVNRNLKRAYEYEKGKGAANSDTVQQFEKIVKLFNEDVGTYRENGPGALGKRYFQEAAVALGQAFDIAIATENEKNKDNR